MVQDEGGGLVICVYQGFYARYNIHHKSKPLY
jgi:hypothetical protein